MIILKPSLLFIVICFCLGVQGQNRDSVDVMRTAEKFLHAFNNFNWPVFHQSFDDNATIFYPEWQFVRRVSGKKAVEKTWLELFPEFADTTNTSKMDITPKDVFIQLYGETAIVSFHLGDGIKRLSRRTLVFVKKNNEWKIAHLHASSMVADKEN